MWYGIIPVDLNIPGKFLRVITNVDETKYKNGLIEEKKSQRIMEK